MNSPEDKRQFTRIAFDAKARVFDQQHDWQGLLVDISLHGALVYLTQPWEGGELGQIYQLEFLLPGSNIVIRMQTTAAHFDEQLLGLQCMHLDLDSATHLKRLVALNLGDEALLDRELYALNHQTD